MKRHFCFILVLLMLLAGEGFAREINNWISGELGLIGIGIRYERMLNQNFSIGVNASIYSIIIIDVSGVSLVGRYYPSWMQNFFIELGMGYGSMNGPILINNKLLGLVDSNITTRTYGIGITPGVGWKVDVGKPGRFFLQPGIKIPVVIGTQLASEIGHHYNWGERDVVKQTSMDAAFIVYLEMGYAF